MFAPAKREKLKLRMALCGPSGSGKSYTALRLAFALGKRVAAIDTEHGALSKYQGLAPDGQPWDFDVVELQHYAPTGYTAAIKEAGRLGYDVLLVDSLSHAWEGMGGALDQVDKKGGNKFTAWKDVTPQHRQMVDAILGAPMHVIATMRTKTEYVLEADSKGKMVPVKIGTQPVQRAGMEYEFDVVADMDLSHVLTVSKTRCPSIDQEVVAMPSAHWMGPVMAWLDNGAARTAAAEAPVETPTDDSTDGGHDAAPPEPEPDKEDTPPPIAKDQDQQIRGLLSRLVKLGFSIDEFRADWLPTWGAGRVADLNGKQAADCIFKLELEIQKRQTGGN